MQKRFFKVMFVLCICIFTLINPLKVYCADNSNQKIILIDPGHGGIDGGAKSRNGTKEKDINLQISNKLKSSLEKSGYKVYMTREDDKELSTKKVEDLSLRCKMKEETKCDVFVSIHQNMFAQTKCHGAQVWYADNEKSRAAGDIIQSAIKETVNDNNKRIAKCAKTQYKILRDGYDGVSIIVECGFLSNSEEESKLKTDEHQQKIADGIVKGIDNYFAQK